MSKRKVQFSEEVDIHQTEASDDNSEVREESNVKFGKKFKHTLDSDESDDEVQEQNYNVLDCDQISGQEKATIDFEGDVKITPFNMDEELEEGHFDKEGNYIFHKSDEVRDSWLDHIDWIKIKQNIQDKDDKSNDKESDEESDLKTNLDYDSIYQQMLTLMQPNESVQRAIQRLGRGCTKTKPSDRWKNKKNHDNDANKDTSDTEISAKDKLLKLSSLADKLLQTGDMDIYQRTYEQLEFHLKKKSENTSADSDMFSDSFDSTKVKSNNEEASSGISSSNDVMWEFKWEDNDSAQVFGPYGSQQMLDWVNDGYFENGVYVRQIGKTDSQFYNSKRIDFDLYT